VLLDVDHHDAAYRWAAHRKLTINPVTGAMQVVLLEEVSAPPEPAEAAERRAPEEIPEHQRLFAHLSDTEILSLGTPAELLPHVRQITSEVELDALQPVLHIEAYEGLFLVAARDTVSQVLSARETYSPSPSGGFAQEVGFGASYWIFTDINSSILCSILSYCAKPPPGEGGVRARQSQEERLRF